MREENRKKGEQTKLEKAEWAEREKELEANYRAASAANHASKVAAGAARVEALEAELRSVRTQRASERAAGAEREEKRERLVAHLREAGQHISRLQGMLKAAQQRREASTSRHVT